MTGTRLHCHYSQYQWWGVPSRYVRFVDHLDRSRYAVTTSGASDVVDETAMPDWQRRMADLIRPDMLRQHRPWHNLNDLANEAATLDLCRDGKIDIVHFLDGEHSGPVLPQLVRNRLPGVRTVASFHQPPDLLEKVLRGPELRQLDMIILMAPSQVPFFTQFVPREHIRVILHGVDTDIFTPPAAQPEKRHLTCITTGLHLRDWEAFHAVAVALPEVAFTVVTSNRVTLSPLPNVKVLSGISDTELAAAYRAADVLFLPLRDATANNSILEGMASGLPVVSTDIDAVRVYVPEAAGFLIRANAVQDLVSALNRLAGDRVLRARMATAARLRAETLSWSSVAQQYAEAYHALGTSERPRILIPSIAAVPDLRPLPQPVLPRSDTLTAPPLATTAAFASLADWSATLRRMGLVAESGMIVKGLATGQPGQAAAHKALADAAEADWRWCDAADQWEHFLRLCPQDRRGEGLMRLANAQAQSGAISLALKTLEGEKSRSFATLLGAARLAENFGTSTQAGLAWTACTNQYPDQVDGFVGQARHYLRLAQFDAAEELLEHARRVWPDAAGIAALWARSADEAGLPVRIAALRWDRALAMHGKAMPVLLGFAHHIGRSADLARRDSLLNRAAHDPYLKAEILLRYHVSAGEWDQASDQARRVVAYLPADLGKRLRLADVLLQLGTPIAQAEAVAILQTLRKHAPDAAGLLPSLGFGLIAVGDDDAAQTVIAALPEQRLDRRVGLMRLWAQARVDGNVAAERAIRRLIVGFCYTMPEIS